MAAEDAPVRVELVDDDIAKILEERRPFRMVREDPRVEHVGVRQHEIRPRADGTPRADRKSTRLNSSHLVISYAVFCLKKKKIVPGEMRMIDYDRDNPHKAREGLPARIRKG